MKIVSLIDSAAGFLPATVLSRALRPQHAETLVHLGPHTDFFQARAYLDHIDLLEPDVNLELGAHPQGIPLGEMLIRLERVFLEMRPELLLVRGDSDTTLAGALAAARIGLPVARLEAGVRSYTKRQPQELNRLLVDRLADVLFCATTLAVQRLAAEGIIANVHWSGDVGLDIVTHYLPVARQHSSILQRVGLYPEYYLLAVIHAAASAREPAYLRSVVKALNSIREPIVFPMPAPLRAACDKLELSLAPHVLAIDPLGYLDTLNLEAHARAIITDVERVQREAYHLAVPCLTLRDDSAARETVDAGWNCLIGGEADRIVEAVRDFLPPLDRPPLFGDGHAAERVAALLDTQAVVYGQNYDRVLVSLPANLPVS